ncbi:hypothetical protein A5630_25390 [Mycolicibacterium mucogenicum]|uniref:Superinfection immunity protein n=1 Tax=Mycolicibacterium mucogenicum TaxID=56689 RepID=A0A1A3GY39_MYCMU|nr:superinfection immunity protein [Mycolicibacterium mucogenicum]OBJ40288.1 hypothetical protein A5630_25390 [Mycolicibacterium mucogenicum]
MEFLFLLALYFVPTFVVFARRVQTPGPTIVINIFLGWTFIGWVVALAMAFGAATKPLPPLPPKPVEPIPPLQ